MYNTSYDHTGNSLGVYPSGIAVAQALGVQQGDISLCCRGLKFSVANHRFRFYGDPDDQFEMVKKRKIENAAAAILVADEDPLLGGSGRSRRVSRGDYHVKVSDKEDHVKPSKNKNQYVGPKLSEVAHIKVKPNQETRLTRLFLCAGIYIYIYILVVSCHVVWCSDIWRVILCDVTCRVMSSFFMYVVLCNIMSCFLLHS